MKDSGLLPYHAILELTYRCNFNCLFCYCKGRVCEEQNYLQWRGKLDEIYRRGVRSITFSGGEPLLFHDLECLIEYAKGIGFNKCKLFSNGSILSIEHCKFLKRLDVDICVSLSEKKHYLETTGSCYSYDAVLSNVCLCREFGLDVSISSVLTKSNYRGMRGLIEDVTSVGVEYVQFGFAMREGGMLEHPEEELSCADRRWVLKMIPLFRRMFPNCDIGIAAETKCVCQSRVSRLLSRLQGFKCGAGERFVVISPDGHTRPCVHVI